MSRAGALACALLGLLAACGREEDGERAARNVAPEAPRLPRFTDVTRQAGISFVHQTGFDGHYWFPEITGGGCAIFDFDGDGWEDVFFVDGGALTLDQTGAPVARPAPRLYRNLGTPELAFEDVTAASGIAGGGYGQGCTVGDYDGDGDLDLYVANVGLDQLFRNEGGRFTEVSASAGIRADGWKVSPAFGDPDADGDLDLYVPRYCLWSQAAQVPCKTPAGEPDYCNPKAFEAASDLYFRNNGNGTFEDASISSGVANGYGRGLGVVMADLDDDGRIDIFVANDGDPNNLFLNQGGGRFVDEGLLSGVGVNAEGNPEAGMGISLADADLDADWDVFVTHMNGEKNTFWTNEGEGLFRDATDASLAAPSIPFTGFGTLFFDADHDGDEDILVANGAVIKERGAAASPWPYAQRLQLFVAENRRYRELSPEEGPWLLPPAVGRGAAFGDLDRDGDVDVVLANAGGLARVLRNDIDPGDWVGIRLAQEGGNREGIGAEVALFLPAADLRENGRPLGRRRISRDGSYASANQPRALFAGLPEGELRVAVLWPDNASETWSIRERREDITLVRGTGTAETTGTDVLAGITFADTLSASGGVPGASGEVPGASAAVQDTSAAVQDTSAVVPHPSGSGVQPAFLGSAPGGAFAAGFRFDPAAVPPLPELERADTNVVRRIQDAHAALVASSGDPGKWKDYGLALYADARDHAGAAGVLDQAIAGQPDDVRAVYLRGICAERLGDPATFRAAMERTLQLEPSYVPPRLRLARAFLEAGELVRARSLYEESLGLESQNPDALEGLGRVLLQQGEKKRARAVLERAVSLAPNSRGARHELGLAYRASGNLEEAKAHLEAAQALREAGIADAWLAELLEGRGGDNAVLTSANQARLAGNPARAYELYEEYTRRRPGDPVGWSNLGAIARDLGRHDEALAAVNRALSLEPGRAPTMALKASLLAVQGADAEALELLDQALAADPSLAQAWLDRGTLLLAAGRAADAAESYERGTALRPRDVNALLKLADALIKAGNYPGAKTVYARVLEIEPQNASAHYRLGGFALGDQDGESAERHFRAAVSAVPAWAEAHYGRGRALQILGRPAEAGEAFRRALELKPDFEMARRAMESLRDHP